jgi:hypothetical protein
MRASCLLALGLLLFGARAYGDAPITEIVADPPSVRLQGARATYSLLLHGKTKDGSVQDCTGQASFRSLDPTIATVTPAGVVKAVADGATLIEVRAHDQWLRVPVQVEGTTQPRRFNFENDIESLLSRFGCNSAGCHGKAEGQNGFKLSVFGFDPGADYAALTKESRGRRVFPAAPDQSLLLRKISGGMPHGGGVRIRKGSEDYETIRAWIAAGTPFGSATDPRVVSLRVEPSERILAMGGRQQLRTIARYSDGHEADVTSYAKFQSNNEGMATVSAEGMVRAGQAPGDVAVMASYMNAVDTFRALIPRAERIDPYPKQAENNFIDGLVFAKLKKLHILPSEPASDAEYLRRVYLDVIGTLPTPTEARRFLADKRTDRRARLVDALLERPEFADYWALKWADLLRVDSQVLGNKQAYAFYRWIRESFAANKPLDQFAGELLTAEGPLSEVGPAAFYKVVSRPGDAASTVSQVFLGVRIACAECHHHPFDRWGQDDYYGMQAFFAPVSFRKSPEGDALLAQGDAQTHNPRTGETVRAHALGLKPPAGSPTADPRVALARWLTSRGNHWFAHNIANRTWAHFMGRGLVEPVDDVRSTNPPTNPELLDALADNLIAARFDFRTLIRTITASRVYQLSSKPNTTNERDEQNYSRMPLKRIDAEVLLDMVCQTTGVPEKFAGVPAGSRAIQLWDSKTPHYFLKLFGRPVRATACECERNAEPSVAQVLHLLNSPEIHDKLTHAGGTVARLVKEQAEDGPLVVEMYITFYSRPPSEAERSTAIEYLRKMPGQRRKAAEDIAWALMNSLEFVFNH